MQLGNVQYLFTNGAKGLSGASEMIRNMYQLYQNNQGEYRQRLRYCQGLCANLILVSGRNLLQGVLRRPLGYVWAVGAQRVKGGGSRLSCP